MDAPADPLASEKERARAWFESLRDEICASLEALEDEHSGRPVPRFTRKPSQREGDGGGGVMALL